MLLGHGGEDPGPLERKGLSSAALRSPFSGSTQLSVAMESLQVRLCGSTAKVAIGSEDGLEALKGRVASAFNLTAPFDLVAPSEGRLADDQDARRAVQKDAELRVSAGEDALLDLERAREESGVLRWALLRQILHEVKVKATETSVNVGAVVVRGLGQV